MSGEVETELKFQLRTQDLAALKTPKAPRHSKIGPAERLDLSSTYFDTEDRRLLAAGLTLRVRRTGDDFEQTVKAVGEAGAALAARREATTALQGERPDIGLFADEETVRLIESAIDGRVLSPLFVVDVERTVRIVETRSGDRIEFAIDVGNLTAGDRSLPIREAEFELKGGDLRSLFLVARAAMAGVPIRFSMAAKSDLGFRLLDGGGAAEPESAVAIDVAGDSSVELVLHQVLRSCLRQIATNVVAVDAGDDPEGPHQLRVGLRRFRSALKVFAPVIDPSAADRLNQQAKRLGQCVGRVRDLDVLIDEIVGVCAGHVDVGGLNRHLEARRK
ncbi:MAG TPA: inorganic triphosphatase, partial [Methylomirabilota bacterium]|nr:inorganic triphosphatase [Methylomirabilota bacterium]